MTADLLLSRLNRVKRVGPGRWSASCPTAAHKHGDRSRGLSITETSQGIVLLRCHAFGCEPFDIAAAVGLAVADLFPPADRPTLSGISIGRAVIPAQVFDIILFEASIVHLIGCDQHKNRLISEADYAGLGLAFNRLNGIAEAGYGS